MKLSIYNNEEIIHFTWRKYSMLSYNIRRNTAMFTSILMTQMVENSVDFAAILPSQALNGELPGAVVIFIAEMYTIKVYCRHLNTRNSSMVTEIKLLLYRGSIMGIYTG